MEYIYDDCEPADTAPSPCPDWNRGTAYHFDKLSGVIKHLVSATFCSKGLWAQVPWPSLELKMRSWMRWRMGTDAVKKKQGAVEKDPQGMPPIQEAVVL
jgi:hypothetical protein